MNNNARTLRVHAPAKINLTLDVLGQRPDGYHELATIMVPLTLADELEIIFKPQPVSDIRIITAEPELQDPHTRDLLYIPSLLLSIAEATISKVLPLLTT